MIGVVGDDETGVGLADGLRDGGATVEVGRADVVVEAGPDVVVAAGEAAVVDLVAAGVDVPVLVVGVAGWVPSIDADAVSSVADRLVAADFDTRDHGLLTVAASGESVGPAAFDVMLVCAEPGRISEFGFAADGTHSRFRADGVVVATPAGSHGYAHAVGGPRLAPDAAAVAIVPVAAFGLGTPTWVVDPGGGVRLSVERDEGEVSLLVDGRERRRLGGPSAVELAPGGSLTTVALDGR